MNEGIVRGREISGKERQFQERTILICAGKALQRIK